MSVEQRWQHARHARCQRSDLRRQRVLRLRCVVVLGDAGYLKCMGLGQQRQFPSGRTTVRMVRHCLGRDRRGRRCSIADGWHPHHRRAELRWGWAKLGLVWIQWATPGITDDGIPIISLPTTYPNNIGIMTAVPGVRCQPSRVTASFRRTARFTVRQVVRRRVLQFHLERRRRVHLYGVLTCQCLTVAPFEYFYSPSTRGFYVKDCPSDHARWMRSGRSARKSTRP